MAMTTVLAPLIILLVSPSGSFCSGASTFSALANSDDDNDGDDDDDMLELE